MIPLLQILQVADPSQVPRLRCREDPQPQTPYVIPGLAPVHGIPDGDSVLWSVRHHRGVQLAHRFRCPRSSSLSRAHLTASAPFRARAPGPVSGQLSGTASGGPAIMSRFPAAFRPPAFASRSPCSRPGPGPSSRSAYRAPPGARTRTGFPRFTPARYDRGGCPLYPGDGGAPPGRMPCPAGACRFAAASPCTPQPHPTSGAPQLRGINGGSRDSPVRSVPHLWSPGWDGRPSGLTPVLRTPPLPAAHDRAGPGCEHAPGTTRPT